MTFVLANLLAAYTTLVAPLLSYRRVRQLQRSDVIPDKARVYRRTILMQAAVAAMVAVLSLLGGVPAASLGLIAPRSWWMSASVGGGFIGYFVYVGIRQRSKARKLRERMQGRGGGLLLPDTMGEMSWFAVMCVLSGIAEEPVYRGFLCFYISLYLPHINGPGLVLLTSLVFGIGHAYQGWRGIASTTVSGLIFGTLYVASGSLVLPAVVHSTGNLQAVLILWPQPDVEPNQATGTLRVEPS
jgi:membrane protease YdiL (CAAX protease family)